MYSYPAAPAILFHAVALSHKIICPPGRPPSPSQNLRLTQRSSTHLGVSCLRTIILTYQPTLPPPSGTYCMTFSPNLLLLLSSCKIPARVAHSFSLLPLGATKPTSCDHPLRTLSHFNTLQIVGVTPPTVPRLPAVSLYRSLPTAFRASPTFRLLTAALASP